MNIETFTYELKKIGIILTKEKLEKLEEYYSLLIEWNSKTNLTRITEKKDVYLKHFYDSLTIIKAIDLNQNLYLCDVGTGAGFPGIVLKIFFPNLKIVLIDSLNKRIIFLNEVIKKLNLNNIDAIHIRMEDYSKINKEKFDIITSRAVANISLLSEISVQSLKIGGHFIFLKGNCEEELERSRLHLSNLNCKLVKKIIFKLPIENSNRSIVDIEKVGPTSNKYPRNIDKIKKSL